MKKRMLTILGLVVMTVAALGVLGCGEILEEILGITDVDGTVVNAMADGDDTEYWTAKDGSNTVISSLEGAVISFYPQNADGTFSTTASKTDTVNSSGEYSVTEITSGRYKISGSQSGWSFVPRVVVISGEDMEMPPLIAYPTPSEETLLLIVSWEDTNIDLDGIVTFYDGTDRDYVGYLELDSLNHASNRHMEYNTGIVPAQAQDSHANGIVRDRDIQYSTAASIPRVETIRVPWSDTAPYLNSSGIDAATENNILHYYVNCYSTSYTLTGVDGTSNDTAGSFAQVDVMYTYQDGSSYSSAHYGAWTLPWNSGERTLNVVNVTVDSDLGYVIYTGSGVIVTDINDNGTATNYDDDYYMIDFRGASDSAVVPVTDLR